MSKSGWMMEIYNSTGKLWERIEGESKESLRASGVNFTTGRGQKTWTCRLFFAKELRALCKRGVWTEMSR